MSTNTQPLEANPLNLVELAFLQDNLDKPVEQLAEALKRPKNFVEFEIKKLAQSKFEQESTPSEKKVPAPESVTTTVKKDSPLLNSFVRRKEGGVVAMSGAAAQLSDEVTKGQGKKTVLETRPDCVTRVRK